MNEYVIIGGSIVGLARAMAKVRIRQRVNQTGVRSQALTPDGKLVDDFLVVKGKNSVHVCNARSPAATAPFEIRRFVANQVPKVNL